MTSPYPVKEKRLNMLLKVGLLGLTLVTTVVVDADARSSSSRYSMYGYSGRGADYDAFGYNGRGAGNYEGYNSRSYGSTGSYWGGVKIQKYDDPTGDKVIYVEDPTPPLPQGNYGRAYNRLRNAY